VPDEKIPEGKGVRILCPKCRGPIESENRIQVSGSPEQVEKPAAPPTLTSGDEDEEESLLEVVEDWVRTSLLYLSDQSRREKMAQVLKQLDFYVSTASSAKIALKNLNQNRYDLVILSEIGGGTKEPDNLVLQHIQLLPMHVRRQFYLCLVSESRPTLDAMLAFRLGVNLIVNNQDLEKAKIILARSLKDYKNFYGFFNAELNRKLA